MKKRCGDVPHGGSHEHGAPPNLYHWQPWRSACARGVRTRPGPPVNLMLHTSKSAKTSCSLLTHHFIRAATISQMNGCELSSQTQTHSPCIPWPVVLQFGRISMDLVVALPSSTSYCHIQNVDLLVTLATFIHCMPCLSARVEVFPGPWPARCCLLSLAKAAGGGRVLDEQPRSRILLPSRYRFYVRVRVYRSNRSRHLCHR